MADDRLACCRVESISDTRMPNLILRAKAISLSPHQNSSSTLTLVLRPEMTTLRFRISVSHPASNSEGNHLRRRLTRSLLTSSRTMSGAALNFTSSITAWMPRPTPMLSLAILMSAVPGAPRTVALSPYAHCPRPQPARAPRHRWLSRIRRSSWPPHFIRCKV